jgi:hypothetical protein
MICRPCEASHNWVRQTPRIFKIILLDIIFLKWSLDRAESHTIGYGTHLGALRSLYWNFSLSTRYNLNFRILSTRQHECALLAQVAHASLEFHHELNIWQRISLLKVRLLKIRIIQQVTKQVSKEIKGLIQVVTRIMMKFSSFNKVSTLQAW